MDSFKQNYTIYYRILKFTGLWPFDNSILAIIKRIAVSALTLTSIGLQVSTYPSIENKLTDLVTLLAYLFVQLLFICRYLGFMFTFPSVKYFIQYIQNDSAKMQNSVEVKILLKHREISRRILLLFLLLTILAFILTFGRLIVPTILRSDYRYQSLRIFGFFFPDMSWKTDWACIHFALTVTLGMLIISCTEGYLAVFSLYLSGMFEIVTYRIGEAINAAARLKTTKKFNIGPAMEIHQNILKINEGTQEAIVFPYLVAILLVIVSFAIHLYRASKLITDAQPLDDILTAILVVFTHLLIMFLNNFSGQQVCNVSVNVFDETYNSLWYDMPPKYQKMLLPILMKTAEEYRFTVGGLFSPCYEGFTTMMSSSFSYFTVLCSV